MHYNRFKCPVHTVLSNLIFYVNGKVPRGTYHILYETKTKRIVFFFASAWGENIILYAARVYSI